MLNKVDPLRNDYILAGTTGVCPYPGKLGWLKNFNEANRTAVINVEEHGSKILERSCLPQHFIGIPCK